MTRLREISVATALAAVLVLLGIAAPRFFAADHLLSVVVRNAPTLVAAVGMTLVIASRQIDISIGSMASICGVTAGLLCQRGLPMPAFVIVAILCGTTFGAVNGWLISTMKLPSIVVTLATMVIGREGLRWVREGEFVRNLPTGFQWFGLERIAGSWTVLAIAIAVAISATWAMRYLSMGRNVLAVGSDPEAARLAGMRPDRILLGVFATMGALTGLAAVLDAVRFSDVDPNSGLGFELKVIAAVVVGGTALSGGRASMLGTVLGVLLLGIVGPALVFLRFEPQWEKAIQGFVILVAVASDAFKRRRSQ